MTKLPLAVRALPFACSALLIVGCAGHDSDRASAQVAPNNTNVAQVKVVEVPAATLTDESSDPAGKRESHADGN